MAPIIALVGSLMLVSLAAAADQRNNSSVPAVFVFGDSLVDTGNNNYIPTLIKANFPPNARDFPAGKPTGRFSNGRCVSDFIAEVLGVKGILPPYLDPSLDLQELLTGVCFASAGAGYDPRASKAAKLYDVGARRIGLLNLAATGCVPALRLAEGGLRRNCSERINRRIRLFNSKLTLAVDKMNKDFPGARVVLFDLYNPVLSLVQNPAPYGIEEVKLGCCGTGNVEAGVFCAIPGTCPDASKYLFWDSFHPSETASKILTYQALTPDLTKLFY
ncbi:GDSL esterase/lipase At3g43570 [Linum grandiflorum]